MDIAMRAPTATKPMSGVSLNFCLLLRNFWLKKGWYQKNEDSGQGDEGYTVSESSYSNSKSTNLKLYNLLYDEEDSKKWLAFENFVNWEVTRRFALLLEKNNISQEMFLNSAVHIRASVVH